MLPAPKPVPAPPPGGRLPVPGQPTGPGATDAGHRAGAGPAELPALPRPRAADRRPATAAAACPGCRSSSSACWSSVCWPISSCGPACCPTSRPSILLLLGISGVSAATSAATDVKPQPARLRELGLAGPARLAAGERAGGRAHREVAGPRHHGWQFRRLPLPDAGLQPGGRRRAADHGPDRPRLLRGPGDADRHAGPEPGGLYRRQAGLAAELCRPRRRHHRPAPEGGRLHRPRRTRPRQP